MKKKHLLFKNYRNAISNAKSLYSPTPKNRQPKTTKIEFYIVEFNLIYMQIRISGFSHLSQNADECCHIFLKGDDCYIF